MFRGIEKITDAISENPKIILGIMVAALIIIIILLLKVYDIEIPFLSRCKSTNSSINKQTNETEENTIDELNELAQEINK